MRQAMAVMGLAGALLWTSVGGAETPVGFAGLPWGSAREAISNRLVKDKCGRSQTFQTVRGDTSIACYEYEIESVGPVLLNLEFVDDTLQGYRISVARAHVADFRAWIRRQLGNPADVARFGGEVATWQWAAGTTAIFTEHCLTTAEACLSVSSPRMGARLPKFGRDPGSR